MVLTIKYENGTMMIYVDKFLDMCNLTEFKKLLKIIDTSYTPEVKEQLKEYMISYLVDVDERLKRYANKGVIARTEYKEQQPSLEKLVKERDRFKRNTPTYNSYMEKVKNQRDKLKHLKNVWLSCESNFNKTLKTKVFYEKCLQLL